MFLLLETVELEQSQDMVLNPFSCLFLCRAVEEIWSARQDVVGGVQHDRAWK